MNEMSFGQMYMSGTGLDVDTPENQQQFVARQKKNTGEAGAGFGFRFVGGEVGVDAGAMPYGEMEQTTEVSPEMASDVAATGEQPIPGQMVMDDVDYGMAAQGGGVERGFAPNSLPASQQATGPMSRGMMNQRMGFGRNFG